MATSCKPFFILYLLVSREVLIYAVRASIEDLEGLQGPLDQKWCPSCSAKPGAVCTEDCQLDIAKTSETFWNALKVVRDGPGFRWFWEDSVEPESYWNPAMQGLAAVVDLKLEPIKKIHERKTRNADVHEFELEIRKGDFEDGLADIDYGFTKGWQRDGGSNVEQCGLTNLFSDFVEILALVNIQKNIKEGKLNGSTVLDTPGGAAYRANLAAMDLETLRTHASAEVTEAFDEKIVSVEVEPAKLNWDFLNIDRNGYVVEDRSGSYADRVGIRYGMRFLTVAGEAYNEGKLRDCNPKCTVTLQAQLRVGDFVRVSKPAKSIEHNYSTMGRITGKFCPDTVRATEGDGKECYFIEGNPFWFHPQHLEFDKLKTFPLAEAIVEASSRFAVEAEVRDLLISRLLARREEKILQRLDDLFFGVGARDLSEECMEIYEEIRTGLNKAPDEVKDDASLARSFMQVKSLHSDLDLDHFDANETTTDNGKSYGSLLDVKKTHSALDRHRFIFMMMFGTVGILFGVAIIYIVFINRDIIFPKISRAFWWIMGERGRPTGRWYD